MKFLRKLISNGITQKNKRKIKKPSPNIIYEASPSVNRAISSIEEISLSTFWSRHLSSFFPWKHKGSMSVEATLIMPFFMFSMVLLGNIFEIGRFSNNLESALFLAAKESAIYMSSGFSIVEYPLIDLRVKEVLSPDYIENAPIEGGIAVSPGSLNKDYIDLFATYKIKNNLPIPINLERTMWNRCLIRRFIGYSVMDEDEEMVYITKNGEVYHKTIDCQYLKIKIESVADNQIDDCVNNSGEHYEECEFCKNKPDTKIYYITKEGNKYHKIRNCPGLRRIIITTRLSEVEGLYRPCSACGKE